jgi:prepilin-type N-terminal cleavage/methylation domain-containing protein
MHKQKAFTVIELLIVIVVIGILAIISVVSISGVTSKADIATLQSDLSTNAKKMKLYFSEYNSYPTSFVNNCPSAPQPSAAYCLTNSSGVVLTYSNGSATTFTIDATKNSINYRVTESTSPVAYTANLYAFTTHTFTSAVVSGRYGPTLAQIQSAYSSQSWASNTANLNMTTQGIQKWTIPETATYRIIAAGAAGGTSTYGTNSPGTGLGAVIQGDFSLTKGDVINILVGQRPLNSTGEVNGGGGGTFVVSSTSLAMIVAGGGGSGGSAAASASTTTSGNQGGGGTRPTYAGGTGGSGGLTGRLNGGGGGFSSNGGSTVGDGTGTEGGPGQSYLNGGVGGYGYNGRSIACTGTQASTSLDTWGGGFGGGSGASYAANGAGGGYSGGGGGDGCAPTPGGGGGSYNIGTNPVSAVSNNGNGYVTITKL